MDEKASYFGEEDIGKNNPTAEKAKSHADPKAKDAALDDAKSTLSKAENGVSGGSIPNTVFGQGNTRQAERETSFTSRVTGGDEDEPKKKKSKAKKFGPIGLLIGLLGGGGGLLFGAQSMMPFGIVNNLMDTFNSMKTVNNIRSKTFFKAQVDSGRNKGLTNIFGNKFSIGNKMAKKLGQQGIEFATNEKGKRVGLVFEQDGVKKLVTINGEMPKGDIKLPDGVSGGPIKFDTALEVEGFYTKVDKGTRTFKGHIVGWFDSMASKITSRLDIKRNKFKNHDSQKSKQKLSDLDTETSQKNKGPSEIESRKNKVEVDVEGKEVAGGKTELKVEKQDVGPSAKQKVDAIMEEAESKTKESSGANMFTQAVAITCAVMTGAGVVLAAIAAYNMMQVLQYVSGITEAIQKAQAGQGDESPINEYSNNMVKPDDNGMTAIQTMGSLFGGAPVNPGSEGAKSYNPEQVLTGMIGGIVSGVTLSMASFITCAVAKVAAATVGIIMDIVSLGTTKLISIFTGLAVGAAIAGAFQLIIKVATPIAIQFLGRVLLTSAFGEEAGLAILSGANSYMGKMHQGSGGSLGDKASVIAFQQETERVIAEEAEYQRRERSPFDITSPYTFLGSIVNRMIPMSANLTSVSNITTSILNITSSSIAAVIPTAGATNQAQFKTALRDDCPMLSSIGAVGDAFCNPYYISDLSTASADPADIYTKVGTDMFEPTTTEGENPKIKLGVTNTQGESIVMSELTKYIVGCGTRDSIWGSADLAIASKFSTIDKAIETGNTAGNIAMNSTLNAIPILGDTLDIVEQTQNLTNVNWISGQNCVARSAAGEQEYQEMVRSQSSNVDDSGAQEYLKGYTSRWNTEFKYYQRYIEDQRLMEAEGLIEKSAVTALLEEVYRIDPLDTSEAGVLARYMGTTKEDAEYAIAQLEHYEFLETYNPIGYGPVRQSSPRALTDLFDNITVADSGNNAVVTNYFVSYNAILRERTVLV